MSPRPMVRVADVDAYGAAVNTYTGQAPVAGPAPAAPWAVYLADEAGAFRLVCFDLDAGRGNAAADAATLAGWLDRAGLSYVVASSGPAGGRHVWLAMVDAVPPTTVEVLARATRAQLGSLDIAPLMNPVTGCVRPPGAPHRHGGTSTVLQGDLGTLSAPTTRAGQVEELVATLLTHSPTDPLPRAAPAADPVDGAVDGAAMAGGRLPVDAHGRLYLPGPRRPLPVAAAAALAEDASAGDASHALWRALLGAVRAGWRCADVAGLVPSSPGLEHVRSHRGANGTRTARSSGQARAVLARHWDRAVTWSATHPRAVREQDPTFAPRCAQVVEVVEDVQARADAAPGRWATAGGPGHRRVLDALCLLSLHAVSGTVEADVRRLALMCGIGRETARTALLRLAEHGWITHTDHARGPHGARWALVPPTAPSSTDAGESSRSQAVTRPRRDGGALDRDFWLGSLRRRLHDVRHDVFTYGSGGLGHHAGQVYGALSGDPRPTGALAGSTGHAGSDLEHHLERLSDAGLARCGPTGWTRAPGSSVVPDPRGAAAARAGVTGRLDARVAGYRLERDLWAWWTAELEWMRAARRPAATRRASSAQLPLAIAAPLPQYGAHPRRPDGRADYRASRRAMLDGGHLDTAVEPAAPARRRRAA